MNKDTTVMMVTYNRLDLTKRMLNDFLEKTKRPFNLVIVDNGSKDGTPEYLSDLISSLDIETVLSCNAENKGIAIGRNQSLKIADDTFKETKWYATIDNDVEVPEGWLDECVSILDANKKFSYSSSPI